MATIVVFAPHNDDHALAMGATIAKHYKAGDLVYTFVASFGEKSHPHLKPEIIRKQRVREAQRADRALGGDGLVQFLGLRELKFVEDFKRKGYKKKLRKKMNELKPEKAYIPATNDTHPDHKILSQLILEILPAQTEVYGYYVYPNLRHLKVQRLLVDVSDSYRKKLDALNAFPSQIHFFSYAFTNVLVYFYTIIINGLRGFLRGTRFIETFYRLR